MQGVEDCCLGQGIPDLADKIIAEKKGVLKMNDVRSIGDQEIVEISGADLFVAKGSEQPSKLAWSL